VGRPEIDDVLIVRRVPRSQAQKLVETLNRPQNAQYATAYADRRAEAFPEKSKDAARNLATSETGTFGGGSGSQSTTNPAGVVALRKADDATARNGAPLGGAGLRASSTTPTDSENRDAPIARGESLQLIDSRMRRNGQPLMLKLTVSEQGTIVVAGLGDVPVVGLTLRQANDRLTAAIKERTPESAGAQLRRSGTDDMTGVVDDAVDVVIVLHRSPDTAPAAPATAPASKG
jgi:protein involved in polysaccharide export with SLBB domain